MGGDSKAGGSETSLVSTAPPWLSAMGEQSADKFQQWMGKQENFDPYPAMTNPYAGYESLFGGKSGPDYLASFSAAPRAAYNQALTDTKNMFGAKGLYGSVGNPMMSGAMASAGQNYATSMAAAQQAAQQAYQSDFDYAAKEPDWQNQYDLSKLNYNNQMTQQIIGNYLQALGISVPSIMQGQQLMTSEDEGKGGGLSSLLGGIGAVGGSGVNSANNFFGGGGGGAMSMFCDADRKQQIVPARGVLARIEELPVYEFEYRPEA
ncbi:MAG: hypothetical protein FWG59_01895, partial [Betaproteobacteria bacterium]|nr:hypothetical protein [Betaproteobacteria bacterium]